MQALQITQTHTHACTTFMKFQKMTYLESTQVLCHTIGEWTDILKAYIFPLKKEKHVALPDTANLKFLQTSLPFLFSCFFKKNN